MKRLTVLQQKWALTSALVAALGVNMSMNSYQVGASSTSVVEMASTVKEVGLTINEKLITSDGVFVVSMTSTKDNKTHALMSPQQTEGQGTCNDCERSFVIDQEFKNDADTINQTLVAIHQFIDENKSTKAARPAAKALNETKKSRMSEDDDRDEDVELELGDSDADQEREDFATLVKHAKVCTAKKGQDIAEKNNCLIGKFLKDLKSEKISKKAAFNFFKRHLEPRLTSQLLNKSRDQETGEFVGAEDALQNIEDLINDLKPKYNSVLERVLHVQAEAIRKSAQQQRDLLTEALANRDGWKKMKADEQQEWTKRLHANFTGLSNPDAGLAMTEAVSNGTLSYEDAKKIYELNYARIANSVYQGTTQWSPIEAITDPSKVNLSAYQLPESTPYANYFEIRGVDANGSPVIVQVPQSSVMSSRVSADRVIIPRLSTQAQSAIVVQPTLIQNTANNGVQFGPQIPVTPQAQDAVNRIRLQYGLTTQGW